MDSHLTELSNGSLSETDINSTLKYSKVPIEEAWRVPIIKEFLSVKFCDIDLEQFEKDEIHSMVDMLCTS